MCSLIGTRLNVLSTGVANSAPSNKDFDDGPTIVNKVLIETLSKFIRFVTNVRRTARVGCVKAMHSNTGTANDIQRF